LYQVVIYRIATCVHSIPVIYVHHDYLDGERNTTSLKSFLSQCDQTQLSVLLLKPPIFLYYYPTPAMNAALQTQFYKCKMRNKQINWITSHYWLKSCWYHPGYVWSSSLSGHASDLLSYRSFLKIIFLAICSLPVLLPGTGPFQLQDFIVCWTSGDSCQPISPACHVFLLCGIISTAPNLMWSTDQWRMTWSYIREVQIWY